MPDQNTWLMHRDQMEILNRIESLLTVAHHERRAIRQQVHMLSEMVKSLKLQPRPTSLKDVFDLATWIRIGILAGLLISGLGIAESLKFVGPL